MNSTQNYTVFETAMELADNVAETIAGYVRKSSTDKKPLYLALSGGNTPGLLFRILAEKYGKSLNWSLVHFFWVDERCVSPGDPQSNFGAARSALLSKIDLPGENIHRIIGEADPEVEAERYAGEIGSLLPILNGFPVLDLVLLGIGEDGHTASIFPGNQNLFDTDKICHMTIHPVSGQKRISLSGNTINNSGEVIFMVTGSSKSGVVREIFNKTGSWMNYPASLVVPVNKRLKWLLDSEAASMLKL